MSGAVRWLDSLPTSQTLAWHVLVLAVHNSLLAQLAVPHGHVVATPQLYPEGDNRGISGIFPYFPDSLDFWIFRGILESGRYIGGILDHMGSISMKYRPKRTHMDLIRTNFLDFVPNLAYFNLFNMYIFSI